MFTISAPHRTPTPASTGIATAGDPGNLVLTHGFMSPPSDPAPSGFDMADIGRRLNQDLDAADAAIEDGRRNDAHDALIRAQDIAFDVHLTLIAARQRRRNCQSTDVHLRLTNRLIDANRTKDRTIIAECRSLVGLLTEIDG